MHFRWLLLIVLAGCRGSADQVFVEVVTDMLPGIEFTSVRTAVIGSDVVVDGDGEEMFESTEEMDFIDGVRVASLELRSRGTLQLRLSLLDESEDVVQERTVVIAVEPGITGVQVHFTRDCTEVMCPDPGGDAALTACLAGQCVEESCVTGAEESCPPAGCEMAADCAAGADCAAATCLQGICYLRADHGACGAQQYCNPMTGCEARRTNSGATDAGVDTAGDDAAAPSLVCTDFRPEIPASRRIIVDLERLTPQNLATYQLATFVNRFVVSTDDGLRWWDQEGDGEAAWPPFLDIEGRVDTILATNNNVFLGSDDWAYVYVSTMLLWNSLVQSNAVTNAISFGSDSGDPTIVFAGTRSGQILRWNGSTSFDLRGATDGSCAVTSIAGAAGGEYVAAATGCADTILESMDNGATDFSSATTGGSLTHHAILWWAQGAAFLTVSSPNGDETCEAVYSCGTPCRNPVMVGDSDSMGGPIVTLPSGTPRGCNLAQRNDVVVAGSSNEVWLSTDSGEHFFLVDGVLNCGDDTLYEIELNAEGTLAYLATSTGLYSFEVTDVAP